MIDFEFLQTQACPSCTAPLVADEVNVYCVSEDCRHRFPVDNRVPMLLKQYGTPMRAKEWERALRATR